MHCIYSNIHSYDKRLFSIENEQMSASHNMVESCTHYTEKKSFLTFWAHTSYWLEYKLDQCCL